MRCYLIIYVQYFKMPPVLAGDRDYGIGTSQKNADLALELAQDGALVMQLTDAQREFIENGEVEAYRQQQV